MPDTTSIDSDRRTERTFNNQIANKEEYGNVEENRPALVVAALTGATALPAMAGDMNNALGGALGR